MVLMLLAVPTSDRSSDAQQQKLRNESVYFYLTLSTYILSYMYAELHITFLRVQKYLVKISML